MGLSGKTILLSIPSSNSLILMHVSTTRVRKMVGVKECSMEDEGCSLENMSEVSVVTTEFKWRKID